MKVRLSIQEDGSIVEGVHAHRAYEHELGVDDLVALTHDERQQLSAYAKRGGPSLSVTAADIGAIRTALRRDKEVHDAREKAREAAARELEAFAQRHYEDLSRSVADGYTVLGEIVGRLAQEIEKPFKNATIVRQGTKHFNDLRITVRDDPRRQALDLRTRVLHHVVRTATGTWPACLMPTVSDVVRIEDYGFGRTPEKYTGVVVTLSSAATADLRIIIRSD